MRKLGRWLGAFAVTLAGMAGCKQAAAPEAAPAPTAQPAAEKRDLENLDPKSLYDVVVQAPEAMRAGEEGRVTIALRPKDGAEIKPETPLRGQIEARGALTTEKTRIGYADNARVEHRGPVFEIPVKAESAGEGELGVDLDFYICVAELCMKTEEDLRVATRVQ